MKGKTSQTNDIQAVEMPSVKEYLTAVQRDGTELCAKDVYERTVKWLKGIQCEHAVSEQVIEEYSMAVARWVHLEQMISKYGYIAKHPTTGAPIPSPYVAMAQGYLKQISAIRAEINQIIKYNRPIALDFTREVVYGG